MKPIQNWIPVLMLSLAFSMSCKKKTDTERPAATDTAAMPDIKGEEVA